MAIPAALEPPLRALLRGERSVWPAGAHDEGQFLAAAGEHGIAPLLYSRLDCADWPDSVRAALRDAAVRAAALEPFRLADLRALLDALAARGVDALVVKGSALAYSLYDAPDLRPRTDTDLLIEVPDVDTARAVFHGLGYVEQASSRDELVMRQTMFIRADPAGVSHIYDVHWAVANTPVFADVLRFDELRARAVALPRIGEHARTIADVDALLYACIHRVAHHHDSDRLIWLADIHLLRERMPPEEHARFWALAAEREVVGVCMRSVERAREWFGGGEGNLAADFLDAATIARPEATRSYLDRRQRRLRILRAELAALRGWRARGQRLRQLAFPPASFMSARFGTRSRLALPWLYAFRAARGVARLFRRIT
jgi:hypothetical protein